LQAQLEDKKVVIEADELALEWFARHGYDAKMGARPMARLIQDKLKKPLAEEILFGKLALAGGTVHVTAKDDEIELEIEAACIGQAACRRAGLPGPVGDAALAEIVGRQFDFDFVAGEDTDVVLAHFP